MIRLLRAALASALVAGSAGAQETGAGRVVGRVSVAGTDIGLAYAVVAIPALGIERFTDAGGGFVLGGIPAGVQRLRVRRVGYGPRDTTVTVAAGATTEPVAIGLERLAVQLATVRVRARGDGCRRPGPPDPRVDPVAAALFEQVKQNAERARLLSEQHPYRYLMERSFGERRRDGAHVITQVDTLAITSARSWRYAPGRIVARDTTANGAWMVHLPTLEDLADSAFQRTHCYDYVGLDTLLGRTMARVDVTPARGIRAPDVEGAVYLDSASFQIRWTILSLTRPERAARFVRGVASVRITTQFQEVRPALPIISGIRAVTEPVRRRRDPPRELVETQFLLDFEWTGVPP